MTGRPATLALADGTLFTGRAFGADASVTGEVVFTTGMTGYQEVLTDPSYCGQIVTMTSPHIGNTGINSEDPESVDSRPQVAASSCATRARRLELPFGRVARPVPPPPRHRRDHRHRHAQAHAPPARQRLAERLHRLRGPARARRARPLGAQHGGLDLVQRVTPNPLTTSRKRAACGTRRSANRSAPRAKAPRRRARLRSQAQHPACLSTPAAA
jgi:hypothetical protein